MKPYARPQWTNRPCTMSDGAVLEGHDECPSCLGYHHASLLSCNGKREPCESRCSAVIGEIQCDRPANHLREHEAKSELMRVEWEFTKERVDAN